MKQLEKIIDCENYELYIRDAIQRKLFTNSEIYKTLLVTVKRYPSCYFRFKDLLYHLAKTLGTPPPPAPCVSHHVTPYVYFDYE